MNREPWVSYPHIWKNSTAWFTYLRGCLRKAWSRNPVKLEYIKNNRIKIKNPNPKGKVPEVWGAVCECCGEKFVMKDLQVDHIIPAGGLTKTDDIQGFIERLLYITDDDIRLLCKNCHGVITYQEKHGLTFDEALVEKKVIDMMKNKEEVNNFLKSYNIVCKNDKQRRESLREILKK
jgi:5-methylcytosine-specific restriction endonuclease McrA